MRKLIFIIYMMVAVGALSSCDWLAHGRDSRSHSSEVANSDPALQDTSNNGNDSTNKNVADALKLSQELEKDRKINMLRDSVDTLSVHIYNAESDIESMKGEQESMQAEKLATKTFFVFIAIFFVVMIALVFILVKKFGLTNRDVEKVVQQATRNTNVPRNQNSSRNEYLDLKRRIENLEIQIKTMNSAKEPKGYEPYTGNGTNNTGNGTNEAKDKGNSRVFYMSKPSGDCEFTDSEKHLTATEDTLYKFELKGNTDKAMFEFYSQYESGVREALMLQDIMIERVCDAEILNRNNGKYKCTEKGEVELRGGKWVVTKKAKVRFY